MDSEARRRLAEAVEQARAGAAEAASKLEREPDAPRAVQSAVREAEEALRRVGEDLKSDG